MPNKEKTVPVIQNGRYRHYKGGLYEVVGSAKHSETEEEMVIYRPADASQLWVRPLKMFMEEVVVAGKRVPRFACLDGEHQ